jgi:hypothetical protein
VFTLDSSDFVGPAGGLTYVVAFNNRAELGVNLDYYRQTVTSFYSGYLDEFGYPIGHDSTLRQLPLTVDFRLVPAGRYAARGRGGGSLRPVFYLGAGVGVNFWEYEESGEFLDFRFDPPEIFYDRFVDDGQAFQATAFLGLEFPISQRINLLLEGRYAWVTAELGGDFAGLGELDLGGVWGFVGASFRF